MQVRAGDNRSSLIFRFSITEFYTGEEASGLRRTIDVVGVAVPALVEIILIGIEHVLNAAADFHT